MLAETCENLYKAGLKDAFYQPVRTYVLNPKSITMGELYGEVNKLTMEWRDGLMAMTVRKAVQVNLLIIINIIIIIIIQRLSVLIQWYNAILLHDCFVKEEEE